MKLAGLGLCLTGLGYKRVDPFMARFILLKRVTRQTRLSFFFFFFVLFFFTPNLTIQSLRRIRNKKVENPLSFFSISPSHFKKKKKSSPSQLSRALRRCRPFTSSQPSPVLQSSLSLQLAGRRSLSQLSACCLSQLSPSLFARRHSKVRTFSAMNR
jgi:hypothetical protein